MRKGSQVTAKAHPNYYLALDIVPGASQNEIHHAYKRAKMTYTQDSLAAYSLIEEDNNEQIMQEIEDAYEILGHPAKRREYDIKMGFDTWNDKDEAREAFKGEMSKPSIASPDEEDLGADNPFDEIDFSGGTGASSSSGFSEEAPKELEKAPREAPVMRVVSNSDEVEDEMHFEANPEFEEKIRNCEALDGAFLRAVRVYREVSVEQLATCSKLAASRIRSLEDEDFSNYPLPVYIRGHLAILCNELNIPNGEELAKDFVNRLKEDGKLPNPSF